VPAPGRAAPRPFKSWQPCRDAGRSRRAASGGTVGPAERAAGMPCTPMGRIRLSRVCAVPQDGAGGRPAGPHHVMRGRRRPLPQPTQQDRLGPGGAR
jgi:hypothetical protein